MKQLVCTVYTEGNAYWDERRPEAVPEDGSVVAIREVVALGGWSSDVAEALISAGMPAREVVRMLASTSGRIQ